MKNTDDSRHRMLMSSYIFNKFRYHQEFNDRIAMDLGMVCYNISSYSKELDALSDEELTKKFEELKKPWWYDVYEETFCDKEHFFEVLYPQYKHSLLEDVMKDEEAYKVFCNNYKAHKPDERKLLAMYPYLHDEELKDILDSKDRERLMSFINDVVTSKQ